MKGGKQRKRDNDNDSKGNKKKRFEKPNYNNNVEKQPLPRNCKISIALPGSIIDNCQGLQMKSIMASQIARACAIYRVSKIIIFNDTETIWGARFLEKILNYLETPQYLRRKLYKQSDDFKFIGSLPPLDCPHHFRKHDRYKFREGVVVEQLKGGCLVDVGLEKPLIIQSTHETNTRVTIKLEETDIGLEGEFVERNIVEKECYWGYQVQSCKTLTEALTMEKYDYILGTSERGESVEALSIPDCKNVLICFGGVDGLEKAHEHDGTEKELKDFFSSYININPHQGSRTIRTEEAVLATLSLVNSKF